MGQQRPKPLRIDNLPESGYIFGVKGFGLSATGVAGKKLKGIGFNFYRFFTSFFKSTSD
jgi:hypothetical protein